MNSNFDSEDSSSGVVPGDASTPQLIEAVEGCRLGNFSLGQVARLLDTSISSAGEILAAHGCRWELRKRRLRLTCTPFVYF